MSDPSVDRFGDIYGGLLLRMQSPEGFRPITFPFDIGDAMRGNHVKPHENTSITSFDYWQSGRGDEANSLYVAERGIGIDGRMVGANAAQVLRNISHRVLTINEGVKREDRLNMRDMVYNTVYPHLQTPAAISMAVQSSQPKFLLFTKQIPLYLNVFLDEHCMLLMWSNRDDMDKQMRAHYGDRFFLFRMKPIVDGVMVLHSFYFKKKFKRWQWNPEMQDPLKLLNALDATIMRRTLTEHTTSESNNHEDDADG